MTQSDSGKRARQPNAAMRNAAFRYMLRGAKRLAGGRHVFVTSYAVAPVPRWGWNSAPNAAVNSILEPDRERFESARETVAAHLEFLSSIPTHGSPVAPHWDNDFWGALDAAFQCACLIDRSPARYVEVGSGYSTMFARHTIDAYALPTTITSIDPAPRADIDALCDEVVRLPPQEVDPDIFTSLQPGDIVLFDGSHEAYMAADSVVMLLEILPSLPAGVLVGIDDVFLPWDYPSDWADRFYAEQYLLASYLLGGGNNTTVVLPAFYITRADKDYHRFDDHVPRLGSFGKSFWLERN